MNERRTTRALAARRAFLLGSTGLLAGCSIFNGDFLDDWFGTNKTPIPGKREAVLAGSHALDVDPADASPVTLPPPVANADWAQPGGSLTHAMGNLQAGSVLIEAWHGDIGVGGGYRRKLTSTPLVADGRVYTMDSDANVAAFDLQTGSRLWRTDTQAKTSRSTNIGGGITSHGGIVYAATGRGDLVAIDGAKGGITWRAVLAMPARSAPSWANGLLYVVTVDDQVLAMSDKDGSKVWAYQATNASTSLLGQPAPAVSDGLVVAGFGSGDLAALRADSGVVVWTDSLALASGRASVANLSAIHGMPVIDRGVVYAIGLGGLMLSLDLRSGRRLWERAIGGSETPWLAGDWIFVLTADQQLVCLRRADGHVRWVSDLPRYGNPEKLRNPITWTGPLLAGGRLVLAGDNKQAMAVSPVDGKVLGTHTLSGPASVPPVLASGALLLITDNGDLLALR